MDRLTRVAALAAAAGIIWVGEGCRERAQAVQGEAELREMVRRMMPVVAEAAQLPFKREPLVLRRSRDQVRDYVIHKFDQDLPPAELAGLQAALRLFGLIPDTLELRRTMIEDAGGIDGFKPFKPKQWLKLAQTPPSLLRPHRQLRRRTRPRRGRL